MEWLSCWDGGLGVGGVLPSVRWLGCGLGCSGFRGGGGHCYGGLAGCGLCVRLNGGLCGDLGGSGHGLGLVGCDLVDGGLSGGFVFGFGAGGVRGVGALTVVPLAVVALVVLIFVLALVVEVASEVVLLVVWWWLPW